MNTKILDFIANIKPGEIINYKNISIIPLFLKQMAGPHYITLDEAIGKGALKINEVSTGGNVPELIAENTGSDMVILLDGEEVIGAKQNRVLNATILLAAASKTVIPVSCVEAHRWSYTSKEFGRSENVLNYDTRRAKQSSVSASLKNSNVYMSDQGEIWEKIDEMSKELKVESGTRAMSDVYKSYKEDLDNFMDSFSLQENQTGIFVFIDGRIAGFDIVSRPQAYSKIHPKLIRSYCLDALRRNMLVKEGENPVASAERAKYFLEEIKQCNESFFKSIGLGHDYRYEGRFVLGSALLVDDNVIHMTFFKNDEPDISGIKTSNMQSYRNRMKNKSSGH
jgi:hypothetical protein